MVAACRVLIVESQQLLAEALSQIIRDEPGFGLCGAVATGGEAASAASRDRPDVILLANQLPDMSGIGAAELLRSVSPRSAVVFWGLNGADEAVLDAAEAGASAYLSAGASVDEIVATLRRAADGETLIPVRFMARALARRRTAEADRRAREKLVSRFTRRELDVLQLLAEGADSVTMAERLGIGYHTLQWHIGHLLQKLNVHSRLEAVVVASELRLVKI